MKSSPRPYKLLEMGTMFSDQKIFLSQHFGMS